MRFHFARYITASLTIIATENVGQAEEDAGNAEDIVGDYRNTAVDQFFSVSTREPAPVADHDVPRAGEE